MNRIESVNRINESNQWIEAMNRTNESNQWIDHKSSGPQSSSNISPPNAMIRLRMTAVNRDTVPWSWTEIAVAFPYVRTESSKQIKIQWLITQNIATNHQNNSKNIKNDEKQTNTNKSNKQKRKINTPHKLFFQRFSIFLKNKNKSTKNFPATHLGTGDLELVC